MSSSRLRRWLLRGLTPKHPQAWWQPRRVSEPPPNLEAVRSVEGVLLLSERGPTCYVLHGHRAGEEGGGRYPETQSACPAAIGPRGTNCHAATRRGEGRDLGSDLRVSRPPPATVRRFFGPATVRSPQTDTRQPSSPHAGPLKRCPLTPPPSSPPQLGPGAPQAARPLVAPRTAAGPPPAPRAAARGECQPGTRRALSGLRSRPLAPGWPAHLSWRQARPRR